MAVLAVVGHHQDPELLVGLVVEVEVIVEVEQFIREEHQHKQPPTMALEPDMVMLVAQVNILVVLGKVVAVVAVPVLLVLMAHPATQLAVLVVQVLQMEFQVQV